MIPPAGSVETLVPLADVNAADAGSQTVVNLPLQGRDITLVRGRRTVLQDVNLTVGPGEIVAVLGGNGAGKTTLLECLAGGLAPAVGEVRWFGETASRWSDHRRQIGYLSQYSGLYLELTVRENLLFAARMYAVPDAAGRVTQTLNAIGLQGRAHQAADRLSLGMRRRLAIARATIHDPPILLLDEPFANLDSRYREWLQSYLIGLRDRGRAICLSSHDPQRCQSVADRRVLLRDGRLVAECIDAEERLDSPPVSGRR